MPKQFSTRRRNTLARSRVDRERIYQHSKMMWQAAHPAATPREYEAAMRRLAKLAGV